MADTAQFESYDFDGDARWTSFKTQITLSPDKENDPATIRRLKAKFYKKHVDPSFSLGSDTQAGGRNSPRSDTGTTGGTAAPTRPSWEEDKGKPSQASGSSNSTGSTSTSSSSWSSASSGVGMPLTTFLRSTPGVLFALNSVVFLCSSGFVFSLLLAPGLSAQLYRYAVLAGAGLYGLTLYLGYGRPQFNAAWWMRPMQDSTLHYLLLIGICWSSDSVPLLLLLNLFAVYQICSTLTVHGSTWAPAPWAMISGPVSRVLASQSQILSLAATAELLIGLNIILSIFSGGLSKLLVLYLWTQILTFRYMTSAYTVQAVSGIKAKSDAVFGSAMTPSFLKTAYNALISYFARQVAQSRRPAPSS